MRSKPARRALWFIAVVGAVLLIFGGGMVAGANIQTVRAEDRPAEFDVFWEAWSHVVDDFVDREKVDFTAMTYGAIRGMLATLGDENHTTFFTPEEAEQQASSLEGEFEGIGAYVGLEEGVFRILAPIHGSPAEAAGLLAGDVVVKVDGESIEGLPEWEIISRIRGPAGTEVVLSVIHPETTEAVEIAVTRDKIEIDSVLWTAIPGTDIAYLQIAQFADDTDRELEKALDEINAHEPAFAGIVLDLRNNPGGYLNVAINAASQFLAEDQVILFERDAQGNLEAHKVRGEGRAREIPMIAMINPGTASAGEILAGALQQNGRARLVGETTLGTGTVLRPYTLSDGSVLRLGITNWLTPDQELLKDKGVAPDVVMEMTPETKMVDNTVLAEMTPEEVRDVADPQFRSALFLLRRQLARTTTAGEAGEK